MQKTWAVVSVAVLLSFSHADAQTNPTGGSAKQAPIKTTPKTKSMRNKYIRVREGITKVGPEIKIVKTSNSLGVLLGGRYVHYESNNFFAGGAGYTGQLTGSTLGAFTMGGLVLGYDWNTSKNFHLEFSLMVGGAGGAEGSNNEGGLVMEPSFSFNFFLGRRVMTAFTVGYAYIPGTDLFSSITAGLRFDFLN